MLKCSNSNVVSIGEEMERKLYTDTCRHGKFLQNNGSVSEQFCIRSTCSKLGSSCPKSFIFPEDDFPIRLPCSLTNGSIVTLQSGDKILTPDIVQNRILITVATEQIPLSLPIQKCWVKVVLMSGEMLQPFTSGATLLPG